MNRLAPTASGAWRTVIVDRLPGPASSPWTAWTVQARIRLVLGSVLPSEWDDFAAFCDAWLPDTLVTIVKAALADGATPPVSLIPATPISLGGVVEIGRLDIGSGGPDIDWPRSPLRLPFRPPSKGILLPGTDGAPIRSHDIPTRSPSVESSPPPPPPAGGTPRAPAQGTSPTPRMLQARVGRDEPDQPLDNILRAGANVVNVFLGPPETNALAGPTVSDDQLHLADRPWVVVRVQLTPLAPEVGDVATGDLLVPRTGRSAVLRLAWHIPETATFARAQLALTVDGCVVTVAELSGMVGRRARLVRQLAIGEPDPDRPVLAAGAIVVDADAAGTPALILPSAQRVALVPELATLAENIRLALNEAVKLPGDPSGRAREAFRKALVGAAQAGRDLYDEVAPVLGGLAAAKAVQVVTARAPHALPVELFYTLPAPRDDAVLCSTWAASGDCGPGCGGNDPGSVVCPAGFWGISRVVERHYRPKEQSEAVVRIPAPDAARCGLRLNGLLVAASDKVTDATLTQSALTAPASLTMVRPRVRSWEEWRAALKSPGAGLLVLLPHTTANPPTMEISGKPLHRAFINASLVTGEHPDAVPAVVLFGCDTGGNAADPIGYPTRFLGAGAAVVFASLSLLRGTVAASLASRLVTALSDPHRAGHPVGRILTDVRRAALADGYLPALALTAYGDARWQV